MKNNVKTPFCYQGSKLSELNRLVPYMPNNSRIIEPFLGTGIVSYRFGKDNACIGNDLNPDIYYIWKYTQENNNIFFSLINEYMQESNRTKDYYYSKREIFNKDYSVELPNNLDGLDIWDVLMNGANITRYCFGYLIV